jgi:uncharacterized protein (TIGR00730 family)
MTVERERRCVCFGSSRTATATAAERLAHECGAELARLGWTVMSGGYEGTMGAVSRGAREVGGRVIGVTTPIFEDRRANEALHAEFREPDYLARMATLLRQGHAFVGLPGGLGTLSECTVAWCLASMGHLAGPLLLFRDPWEPVFEAVSKLEEVPDELPSLLHWIDSPSDLERCLGPA